MMLSEICGGPALGRAGFVALSKGIESLAEDVASALRRAAYLDGEAAIDDEAMSRVVELADCSVHATDELRSDLGGTEAMLLARDSGGFWVLVDPRPAGGWKSIGPDIEASYRRRLRFRVLHEVGHTFFYTRAEGRAPLRAAPCSKAEEVFCDRLAAAILLPPAVVRASSPHADVAYEISRRFDVSAHLVARSLATYHPMVANVSLVVRSDEGPRIQWSTGPTAAQAAVDEITGKDDRLEHVHWATRGTQALRVECLSAVR